jgi:signal transduction histidine kinase
MGRVLLNLYNNAFYAVSEKKRQIPDGYEPTVFVRTKQLTGKIEIRIRDNGNGIRENLLDKIFQPFFTTKPAGQGTGLGLSLSYDIMKAQGGEIKVFSGEGDFTEFIVVLPV